MSEPQPQKKHASSKRDWIIRGVVFGGLGVLLILAVLDYRAKQAAVSTATGWRSAVRSKSEMEDLVKSEFSRLPVKGRPSIVSGPAEANTFAATKVETYTWSGVFRKYVVKVYLGLGTDPTIEMISGPGDDTEE